MKKIIAILCIAVLAFSMAACGQQGAKPEAAVKDFCAALKTFDVEGMQKYVAEDISEDEALYALDDSDEEMKALVDAVKGWASKISYTVAKTNVDGDTASVIVDFTYSDASEIIGAIVTDYFDKLFSFEFADASDEEVQALFDTIINEKTSSMEPKEAKATIDFECVKQDNAWLIKSIPEGLENIVSSNATTAFEDALGLMFENIDFDEFEMEE